MPKPISYIQGSFRHSSMLVTFASFESCGSWLTLILLSQTPVLIPEDFNTPVVEPSTASPNDSTLSVAAWSYGVTCCDPCTTPASCPCTGLLPSGMLTPQAYLPISPALLTFLFTGLLIQHARHGPSTLSAPLHTFSSLTTLAHLKPSPLCLCTVTQTLVIATVKDFYNGL